MLLLDDVCDLGVLGGGVHRRQVCSQGTTFEYREIPAELQDKAVAARAFMVEAAAEKAEAFRKGR